MPLFRPNVPPDASDNDQQGIDPRLAPTEIPSA
jgi:hypothetical protein